MLRMALKAALLRRGVHEEVREKPDTILHALGIVILVSLSAGLGLMDVLTTGPQENPLNVANLADRLLGMWLSAFTMVLGWMLWSGTVYLFGTRFLGGAASYNQVLRALGICYGPGVLLVLSSVPMVDDPARVIASMWVLVAGVFAVRWTERMDWVGAVLASLLGWFLFFIALPGTVLGVLQSGG